MPETASVFAKRLIHWQRLHGRHHLPWQCRDAYRVWLSEIMLQQTQVATVADYYPRFVAAFPDVHALAAAEQDAVLQLWAGLGYYSRARNLHKAAQQVVTEFGGVFPQQRADLERLCGVGRSTAAAIAAFAFHCREAILDGNVKRVLCRVFAQDGNPADKAFERTLWALAEELLPENADDMPAYTQGLMDLGATVCKRTKPLCGSCPMADLCLARRQQRTAELPRRKTPAPVQTLGLFWLLLRRRDGALLIGKRPPHGIWAGLYCVPCFERRQEMFDFADCLGIDAAHVQELPAFSHRLTHRLLEIIPHTADYQPAVGHPTGLNIHGSKWRWVAADEQTGYGLPKPLSRLLAQHFR